MADVRGGGGADERGAAPGAGERPSSPPDPGAAEQSQIGGNVATNAGGPHAFKYGVTGAWVTGIEAVVPPGDVINLGGAIRKDVAGYDVKSLLIGSEDALGVITAAWLRLLPAPEARLPVVAFHRDPTDGCAAIERVLGTGLQPAALEYLDGGTLAAAGPAFGGVPRTPGSWCCRRPAARRGRAPPGRARRGARRRRARDPHPALTTRCRRAVAVARRRLDRGHGSGAGR